MRRYWAPSGAGGSTIADALAEVTTRLVGRYGPAAVHLSGGLDSAAVATAAATASRSLGAPSPLAISVVSEGCTEEPTQRAVAADLGLAQRWLRLGPEEVDLSATLDLIARLPFLALGLTAGQLTAFDARAVRDGHGLLLDGEGGDEWLGASPSLGLSLLRSADLVGMWWLVSARSAYRQRPRRQALRELVVVARRSSHDERQRTRIARAVLDHPSTATTAEVLDGLGRHLGVMHASPLWEPEVIEAAVRTPTRALVAGGRYKAPVRRDRGRGGTVCRARLAPSRHYRRVRYRDTRGALARDMGGATGRTTACGTRDPRRARFGAGGRELWIRASMVYALLRKLAAASPHGEKRGYVMKQWTAPVLRHIGDLAVGQGSPVKISGTPDGNNQVGNRKEK